MCSIFSEVVLLWRDQFQYCLVLVDVSHRVFNFAKGMFRINKDILGEHSIKNDSGVL